MTFKQAAAFSLAVLILLTSALFADMYKWVDENGKVHYTDSPPRGKKAKKLDLRIQSAGGPALESTAGSASPSAPPPPAAGAAKVKLYTASWCGYCKKARAYLQARGTPFDELDVETSAQGQSEYRSLGGRGVPVILVGNQRMDGYSEGGLAGMLKQAGL